MTDPIALHAAMEVVHGAEACRLRYAPGADMRNEGPLYHFHYEKPLWWETDAFHALKVPPEEVVARVRACRPGPHLIAVASPDPESLIADYARLGYKTVPTEPVEIVMARRLKPYRLGAEKHPVQRVQTEAQRQFFNSVIDADDPHGRISAAEMSDPTLRYYYIEADDKCVCHARAVLPRPTALNIEPLSTDPAYRRRGMATALMTRAHADAAATGAELSVIVATEMGRLLYSTLDYQIVGYIQKFVPQDWRRSDYPG